MKLFLDTEFTDFINTELISLGFYSIDGQHEFYAEISDYNKKTSSEFVRVAVEPYLLGGDHAMARQEAEYKLRDWLLNLPYDIIEVVFDYSADWEITIDLLNYRAPDVKLVPLFAELVSKVNTKVKSLAAEEQLPWFHDQARKRFYQAQQDYFTLNKLPQHNALNDAKANCVGWCAVIDWLDGLY